MLLCGQETINLPLHKMSDLLVLGNDKIAGLAYEKVSDVDGLDVPIDKSTRKRIIKLFEKENSNWVGIENVLGGVKPKGSKPRVIYHPSIQTRICTNNYRKRLTRKFTYLEPA